MSNFDDSAADAALALELNEAIDRRMMEALYRLVDTHPHKFVELFERAKDNVIMQRQQQNYEKMRADIEQQLNAMRRDVYARQGSMLGSGAAAQTTLSQYGNTITGSALGLTQVYPTDYGTLNNRSTS